MLHHVALEIDRSELDRSLELWALLGFRRVEAPPALAPDYAWVERDGTQIHLALVERPLVPQVGHAAVVVPGFDAAVEALRDAGFEVELRRRHWGSPRAVVSAPGGHRVEFMMEPPRFVGSS